MNSIKLKYISGIIVLIILTIVGSPTFNVHVHHETSADIKQTNAIDKETNCGEHMGHQCMPETLSDHLFENGARIEPNNNYSQTDGAKFIDSQLFITINFELPSHQTEQNIDPFVYSLPEFLIVHAANPRSPPLNS